MNNIVLELNGLVKVACNRCEHITCCTSVPTVIINDVNLMGRLSGLFNESVTCDNDESYDVDDGDTLQLEYVVQSEPFTQNTFEEVVSNTIAYTLGASHVSGCYSVWTCGTGGFDYVINENGHSIFHELQQLDNQYVWLRLSKIPAVQEMT